MKKYIKSESLKLATSKTFKVLQYGVLALFMFLAVILFISAYNNNPWGLKAFAVTSGSMEPTIKTGSLVFTTKARQYRTNDIITFQQGSSKRSITHRIINSKIVPAKDGDIDYIYETKGDVNEEADFATVQPSEVTGKVLLAIPFIGYPLLWAKTQKGYIFLIIIPATIIIYSEFLNIKSELASIIKNRKKKGKITTLADI